jgi:hypothetical protein
VRHSWLHLFEMVRLMAEHSASNVAAQEQED